MNCSVRVGIALALFSLAPRPASSQGSFGTIVGTVTDNTQASVPNAAVVIVNEQTGISRDVVTDELGNYSASSLAPGVYTITVRLAGFQETRVAGVELAVGRTVRTNVILAVGDVAQSLSVTASAPLLDAETSSIGTAINNRDVVALPLNGRSYTDLLLLVPGAVPRSPVFAAAGGHNFSVSGLHPDQNSWSLDGIDNNEVMFKQFGIQPSIDAIQEFRVQTNVTSAEYGGGAGANTSVVLKSGTNELHGAAFEFLRNDILDANDFFRNANGQDKPAYRRNNYGGVLGGPMVIPKMVNGRDKAFWLVNYEGLKVRRGGTAVATVPTQAELAGDLRDQPPIFDPATTRTDPATGRFVRDQISCNGQLNVICPDRINPATGAWARTMWPATGVDGPGNFLNTNPYSLNQYQLNLRGDYRFSDKLTFFLRYSHANVSEFAPGALPAVGNNTIEKFNNAVASWTYVPRPTLVIDFKVGVNRTNIFQTNSNPGDGAAAYLAANPLQGVPIKSAAHPLYPAMGITGYSSPGQTGVTEPTTDLQTLGNVAYARGRHTWKAGFSINNFRNLSDNLSTASFNFSSVATADPNDLAGTGSALASFLFGLPHDGQRQLGTTAFYPRWGLYQFFIQDDFKMSRRLTLNLGLRYEYNQIPTDRYGRASMFDPASRQFLWASANPITGQTPNTRKSIRDPDFNNFAPRVGLAFQLTPKTTVRSGYSVFYASNFLWEAQALRGQWPFALTENPTGLNTPDTKVLTPIQTFYSLNVDVVPGVPPSGLWSLDRHAPTSYTQQWNFGIQQQLASDLLLEVDYVGNKGTKLPVFMFVNNPPPGPGVVGSPEHPRPYPEVGLLIEGKNVSTSNYNGLQTKLEKRFSKGLQFLGSYAWAKYIDVGGAGNTSASFPPDPNNLKADRGPGAFDFRHTFTGSFVYELPFGTNRRFLGGSGIAQRILAGWQLNGIVRYTTGGPINVTQSFDSANTGFPYFQRPDRVLGQPARIRSSGDSTAGWLNPAAFASPALYTFGNLGRNTERGPAFSNWDLGVFKNLALKGDQVRLQYRCELFNAFNNVNLGAPASTFGATGFGRIFSTANSSREIQMALKVIF